MRCPPRSLVVLTLVAAALVWLADLAADPLPIPSLLAVVGMVAGLWSWRGARRDRELGLAGVGVLAGVGYHLWIHLSGRSVPPEEGLRAHVLVDAIGALAWAAAIAALLLLAKSRVCRLHLSSSDPQ